MKRNVSAAITILSLLALALLPVYGQSEATGLKLLLEGQEIEKKAKTRADLQKAIMKFEEAARVMEKAKAQIGKGVALNKIGAVYTQLGEYTKALDYYNKALELRKKATDVKGQAAILDNMGLVYGNLGQYEKALDYHEQSLQLEKKIGSVSDEAITLNNIGLAYANLGQYKKALDYHEQSLQLEKKIGSVSDEAITLNNIGLAYANLGQRAKALDYLQQSLQISKKTGNALGEANALGNIGATCVSLGQYTKALDFFQQSLEMRKKLGDAWGEAHTLRNIASVYAKQDKFDDAVKTTYESLKIQKKLGVSTRGTLDDIANHHLDAGDIAAAEPLIKETEYDSTLGRFFLLKSDYSSAITNYTKVLDRAEKNGDSTALFKSYTGLAKAYESTEDYQRAEEFYEKAVRVVEEERSSLLPSERTNFFEVRIGGFQRSEPAKGLTRVRMKMNRPDGGIDSSEISRARAFADHLAETSSTGSTGIPAQVLEKEQSVANKVAALKKEFAKTDRDKQPSKHEFLSNQVKAADKELNSLIENLWDKYPAYAAVKYPRPVSLKASALKAEEYVTIFDVSTEGVGVKLIKCKDIAQTFYTKWKLEELEKDIVKFRQPFEQIKLQEFDYALGNALYRKLLMPVLAQVPKGVSLIIIPDGILATLPFEALVVSGKPSWKKVEKDWPDALKDYPEDLTFLADEHPISYYQSITALTLARNAEAKIKANHNLLVIADPVFDLTDKRAQSAGQTKISEQEKKNNTALMQTIEDTSQGGFKLKRLAQTTELSDNLNKIYGPNCLTLTGLKANKSDFLNKVAPSLEQYSGIVFATHGVMSTHIPGLMEPFLALTMAPPGTDGFLKMSDVLGLKMNADIVALTACQTGLGKELSGEGVMSMGRAFQYAGAKSVLMSLWSVSESGSVLLTERFFQHLKEGKSKLDSLKAARDDIRNAGYKHPFFWSAFILVGEPT